jgi:DNA phosphorothioation-associated putative methyltransferase
MNPSLTPESTLVRSLDNWARAIQASPVGKQLPTALYVHRSALGALPPLLQEMEAQTRQWLEEHQRDRFTLVKFQSDALKLSYLVYPDFDDDPHPTLEQSIQIDYLNQAVLPRFYSDTNNPPILHRKDTFVLSDYPHYDRFVHLTRQQDALHLLEQSREIGFYRSWHQRLLQSGIEIHDHCLACPIILPKVRRKPKIERHKAAIARSSLSKPVRLAVEAGLLNSDTSFFDYGCGQGGDLERIAAKGILSSGWDPYYRPDTAKTPADIVNLGYIINVIEDMAERREALLNAWNLTQQVLIVAAQVLVDDRQRGWLPYEDGVITSRNTFQKYYEQEELKRYIDQVLQVDAVPIALGIYLVFRDEAQAECFRAARFRSRTRTPRVNACIRRFEDYKNQLAPLMTFVSDRGRLPTKTESQSLGLTELETQFGSLRRAFKLVQQATDMAEWEAIAEQRRQDLLVYLALSHFTHRPRLQDLSDLVQNDMRSLFGSYKHACTAADLMLLSVGNLETIAQRCRASAIGQQRPNSLWVHVSVLDQLDPLLRLYEGCASRTIGRPEEATLIKFHFSSPKVSYLMLPEFDTIPHPPVRTRMQISLRDLQVRYSDFDADNPPLIHQKEQMVLPDYPQYEKFAKLSQQERRWGLLEDMKSIYDQRGWERCLSDHCATLRGHRVVWRKDADPYRVKLIKSAMRSRSAAE